MAVNHVKDIINHGRISIKPQDALRFFPGACVPVGVYMRKVWENLSLERLTSPLGEFSESN